MWRLFVTRTRNRNKGVSHTSSRLLYHIIFVTKLKCMYVLYNKDVCSERLWFGKLDQSYHCSLYQIFIIHNHYNIHRAIHHSQISSVEFWVQTTFFCKNIGHDKPLIKAHAVLKRSQLIADTACKKQETGIWTHLLFYININWFVINTSCWVTNASFCSIARIKTTCAELYESVSYISNSPIIKIGSHGFISPLW